MIKRKLPWRAGGRFALVVFGVPAVLAATLFAVDLTYWATTPNSGADGLACSAVPPIGAKLQVEARIESTNVDVPQVFVKHQIRVPASWYRAAALVNDEESPAYRETLRCLLGVKWQSWHEQEWRDDSPVVTSEGSEIVVTDVVRTSVYREATQRVGMVRLNSAVSRWDLVLDLPVMYWKTAENVEFSLSAPEEWLGAVRPWPPRSVTDTRVEWRWSKPDWGKIESGVTVHPRLQTEALLWTNTEPGFLTSRSLWWLETFALVVVALVTLRKVHNARAARRAVAAMVPLVVVAGALGTSVASHERLADIITWPWLAWGSNLVVLLAVLIAGWRWWLPRTFLLGVCAGIGVLHHLAFSLGQGRAPFVAEDAARRPLILLVEAGISFGTGLLIIAGAASAVRVLRSGRSDRRLPLGHALAAAAGAAVLVGEQMWIALVNIDRHRWLNDESAVLRPVIEAFRYHPWDLLDDIAWILLFVAAFAVWTVARAAHPGKARRLGIGLFLLGPAVWFLTVLHVELPVWLIAWAVLVGLLAVSRPLLATVGMHKAEMIRDQAQLLEPTGSTGGVSAVDVALALGPGRHCRANMLTATKIGFVLAFVFGVPLEIMWLTTGPLLSAVQSDSVLLNIADGFLWQFGKYVLGAAAIGLLWHQLPGRRGPVRVVPVVVAYGVSQALGYIVPLLVGGRAHPLQLVDIGAFAVAMVVLGLAMDRAVLRSYDLDTIGRWQGFVVRYGLENVATRVTLLLTPVVALLSLYSFLQGGDAPSAPNVDQTPPRR
ncbi:DUF6185 family protein [Lentzea sp. NEAU-D7]|uniref:DUF6185 family protein n=1 Tax=Lentzea sp. NEAU-D7 TaxID=2994667 RepID=UPI00224B4D9A|nr:DUF6185 family protein [Lentzea sp. NEAU-D7]MCX2947017.1 DUF6185 family protein [Lentzea sp. NEAU-D7]